MRSERGNSATSRLRWRARIELRGINPYVWVAATRARRLRPGWARPMPVRVQVNGQPDPAWRVNLMPAGGGGFYLYLNGIVRDASGTKVGDEVGISLAFDREYRGGPVHRPPARFTDGLAADRLARDTWDALPPSRQKEVLRYFAGLRSKAARDRNVDRALFVLRGGSARFLGRDWN